MNINQTFRQHAVVKRNLSEINLATASLVIEKPEQEKPSGQNIAGLTTIDPALILAPFIFLVMTGVVIFHRHKLLQRVPKVNSSQEFICKKCRYFLDNNYLKCVVHPSTVLTKEAVNCCDYHPHDRKLFHLIK